MKLLPIQGTCEHQDFFIYAACDSVYFKDFGASFINSIRRNTNYDIHIHLFNPEPSQLEFCQRHGVAVTWEHAHQNLFVPAAQRWSSAPVADPEKTQYQRTITAMTKGQDSSLIERMQKTYYACARFVRLAEIYQGQSVLAVDIDAVVRNNMPALSAGPDFYIHHIAGKKARYLAGGLWLTGSNKSVEFLTAYRDQIQSHIEQDYLYWSLDQDLLDHIVPRYNHAQLPIEYIDWNMNTTSYIWTAKGTRKNLSVFVNEQQKYICV